MLSTRVPPHRRFSITHRAVQRLRDMVRLEVELDDEALRDHLDHALHDAEKNGLAVETIDAKLGDPQVLVPVQLFETALFAIIKERTVVTVLPYNHGEEILHRGLAVAQRVAAGEPLRRAGDDRWDPPRRPWQDPARPQIERIRGPIDEARARVLAADARTSRVVELVARRRPDDPTAAALFDALERGRRAAAFEALREVLRQRGPDQSLAGLWDEMTRLGLPRLLTVGDLLAAAAEATTSPDRPRAPAGALEV